MSSSGRSASEMDAAGELRRASTSACWRGPAVQRMMQQEGLRPDADERRCPRRHAAPRRRSGILRHGETDWNAQGLSQGNVDIPLNPTGLAQARSAALRLRNRGIATIVSSPLSRARVTAEIAASAGVAGADRRRPARGAFRRAGRPADERLVRRIGSPGNFTPEGAETFAALRRRAVAAVNRASRCRRSCWWWRTARCSARCARRWASSR